MPELPEIRLELLADDVIGDSSGFLKIKRRHLRAHYPDGEVSQPFSYDEVERRALDAVVLAAHYPENGTRFVYLRSALRPPLAFRCEYFPVREVNRGGLWELPAGLIENDERSEAGTYGCAQRELAEELGFAVDTSALRLLGPSTFPCPGVLSERHFFFEISVDPLARKNPSLDGSALEQGGKVIAVPLSEALAWCRSGEIEDGKTEIGLRRLLDLFS
jgi:ADP-ribose pyrophosphatase